MKLGVMANCFGDKTWEDACSAAKDAGLKAIEVISILAIAAMAIVVFLSSKYLIYVLISFAGLGYSAMFPLLISAGSTLYEKGRGLLATFLFLASNIGTASAPFITKFTSNINLALSISFSFILMSIVTIIVILTAFLFNKKINNASVTKELIK